MTKTERGGRGFWRKRECERLIGGKTERDRKGRRVGQRQLRQQRAEETRQKPSALHH